MLIEIILALLGGFVLGIFTGLIPGIHINLIAVIILGISPFLLTYLDPITLVIAIISMSITHTFLDTIPTIYLGVPSADNFLAILPGHKYLLKGKAYEAIVLTLIGSFFLLIISILLFPLLIKFVTIVYPYLIKNIFIILILVSIFLILREKKKFWALALFLTAGVLGLVVLNANFKEPLFPMLSGLFGVSNLFLSIANKVRLPKQIISFPKLTKSDGFKIGYSSLLASFFTSFLPGLGPAQAAIISSQLVSKMNDKLYLILIGGLNTANMVFSFLALFTINKARNGAILVVQKIIENITINELILFLSCSLIIAGFSILFTLKFCKKVSKFIDKINYPYLCISIIILIFVLTIFISSYYGLLILITASFIGMIPTLKNVGKNHLMGCLILPVIFYFSF